jgi:hypothetical protein
MPYFVGGTGLPIRDLAAVTFETSAFPTPLVPSRIRVKNRRKRYLDLHPDYFGPQLELAGLTALCSEMLTKDK